MLWNEGTIHNYFRYDSECLERDMSTQDILKERRGVCRQFVKIFEAMCAEAGVRCKNIKGFAKGDRYVPGENISKATGRHAKFPHT